MYLKILRFIYIFLIKNSMYSIFYCRITFHTFIQVLRVHLEQSIRLVSRFLLILLERIIWFHWIWEELIGSCWIPWYRIPMGSCQMSDSIEIDRFLSDSELFLHFLIYDSFPPEFYINEFKPSDKFVPDPMKFDSSSERTQWCLIVGSVLLADKFPMIVQKIRQDPIIGLFVPRFGHRNK